MKEDEFPLICRNGCMYAEGERTCIVPVERMTNKHHKDYRYNVESKSEGIIVDSRITDIKGRLTPIYKVRLDNGLSLKFFEWEINFGNIRIFNKRKVFNYRPHIRYVAGETVKIKSEDIYIKIQPEQMPVIGKEVVIESVILTTDSLPKYMVYYESKEGRKRIEISEHLIQHSINGKWQYCNSWMHSIDDKSFPDYVITELPSTSNGSEDSTNESESKCNDNKECQAYPTKQITPEEEKQCEYLYNEIESLEKERNKISDNFYRCIKLLGFIKRKKNKFFNDMEKVSDKIYSMQHQLNNIAIERTCYYCTANCKKTHGKFSPRCDEYEDLPF